MPLAAGVLSLINDRSGTISRPIGLANRAAFELSLSVEQRDGDAGRNKSYGHERSGTFRQNAAEIFFPCRTAIISSGFLSGR